MKREDLRWVIKSLVPMYYPSTGDAMADDDDQDATLPPTTHFRYRKNIVGTYVLNLQY